MIFFTRVDRLHCPECNKEIETLLAGRSTLGPPSRPCRRCGAPVITYRLEWVDHSRADRRRYWRTAAVRVLLFSPLAWFLLFWLYGMLLIYPAIKALSPMGVHWFTVFSAPLISAALVLHYARQAVVRSRNRAPRPGVEPEPGAKEPVATSFVAPTGLS